MLEISKLAVGLAMVAQRRSAGLDRLAQNLAHQRHRDGPLAGKGGGSVPPPAPGAPEVGYPPIGAAPGTYVFQS